jgi:hypothetical protein
MESSVAYGAKVAGVFVVGMRLADEVHASIEPQAKCDVFVARWRCDEDIKSVRGSSPWAARVDRLGLLAEGNQQLSAELVGLRGLGRGSSPKMMAKAAILSSLSGGETSMRFQIRAARASSHFGQIHTRPVGVR